MTLYAYDETRHALTATWDTGLGHRCTTITTLPEATEAKRALNLAYALTTLSRLAWRTYTHPASAAPSLEPNSEGWRRQEERDAFTAVVEAVRHPHLPDDDGYILQSYIPVEEAAHRVGRALHRLALPELTDLVAAEAEQELAAVDQAERGELTGRARQAVTLTRADPSPLQVAAASDLLRKNPFGSDELLHEVEPAAAAVAAARWLHAAATVASEAAGYPLTQVVVEADNIEALAAETPTLVLEQLEDGTSPREVVTGLIAAAMQVAEGKIVDPDDLIERIEEAHENGERFGVDAHELLPRLSVLDPVRPAQDLLEDLLDGIRGCWLIYQSNLDLDDDTETDEEDEGCEEGSDEFLDEVRQEVARFGDTLV